jgi:hypothetical protein
MDTLKVRLTTAPILAYPREEGRFILDTDASGTAIGAVLSQEQDGQEKPILFFSRALTKEERNYCVTRRELLAVISAVKHCRHYLLGDHFLIRSDHGSLRWLLNFKNPDGQIARWLEVLGEYDFQIQHRPGTKHGNADGLSRRRPCAETGCSHCNRKEQQEVEASLCAIQFEREEGMKWIEGLSIEDLERLQQEDSDMVKAADWVREGKRPPWNAVRAESTELQTYWKMWDQLQLQNGTVLRRQLRESKGSQKSQTLAPRPIRREIFNQLHSSRLGGHQGTARTAASIKLRFWWPKMKDDINRWCQFCEPCQRRKQSKKPKVPLTQQISGRPLERVGIDILSFSTESSRGNTCALVITDYFTKWSRAFALPDHRSMTVADVLVTEVFLLMGLPRVIHSDQGAEFQSELIAQLYQLLGIKKTRTTPYRPQSDGQVERFNRTLLDMISTICEDRMDDWDDHLPYVTCAYNATPHSSTGCSPNLLMWGREVNLPIDLMFDIQPPGPNDMCPIEYVEWVKQATTENFTLARQQLKKAAARQKKVYDKTAEPRSLELGTWVWRLYPPLRSKDKLKGRYTGPYLVVKKLEGGTYRIQRSKEAPKIVVHIDHLKPAFQETQSDNWLTPQVEEAELQPNQVEEATTGTTREMDQDNFKRDQGNFRSKILQEDDSHLRRSVRVRRLPLKFRE